MWGEKFPHNFADDIELQFLPKADRFGHCTCMYCGWTNWKHSYDPQARWDYVKARMRHRPTKICKVLNEWWYASWITNKVDEGIHFHNWNKELLLNYIEDDDEPTFDTID